MTGLETVAVVELASNIVSFVHFGSELASKSVEIYRSHDGANADIRSLQRDIEEFARQNIALQTAANASGHEDLKRIVKQSIHTAGELQDILNKLRYKGHKKKINAVRTALRKSRYERQIQRLEQQLKNSSNTASRYLNVDTNCTVRQVDGNVQHVLQTTQASSRLEQEELYQRYLDRLPNVSEASFNAWEKRHDSLCLPRTRADLLSRIRVWSKKKDNQAVFWLIGWAGTGKSAIARTVAQEMSKAGSLGASFFFSRGGGGASHARFLVTSIAFQLAKNHPILGHYISRECAKCSSQSLRDQWHDLILWPLELLKRAGQFTSTESVTLIVDALDECENQDDIITFIQLLAEIRSLGFGRLRVFLTSRPELPVQNRHRFLPVADQHNCILHEEPLSEVENDIALFLRHNFDELKRNGTSLFTPEWPGAAEIDCLVARASGLFIWADTACRYISQGGEFSGNRLLTLLSGSGSSSAPEKQLDMIYITVLNNAIPTNFEGHERQQRVQAIKFLLGSLISLYAPLSSISIAELVSWEATKIKICLQGLQSIINFTDDPARPISIHHPSFRDFLLDQRRCTDVTFQLDGKQAHKRLAICCIKLTKRKLRKDILNLESADSAVENLTDQQLRNGLSPDIQYACEHWVQHFIRGEDLTENIDLIVDLLENCFLFWLEALSLMNSMWKGICMINDLESLSTERFRKCVQLDLCHRLDLFVKDAKRFVLANRSTIERYPLQIYYSALVFAPSQSIIRAHFDDQKVPWIHSRYSKPSNWGMYLLSLGKHTNTVTSVAFSPDGNLLASASLDRTVKI